MIISRILLKKMTFHPKKFLCEKKDGHSKREGKELIDLHQKHITPKRLTSVYMLGTMLGVFI